MMRGILVAALGLFSVGFSGCARDSEAYRVFWRANDYYGGSLHTARFTPKEVLEPDGAHYSGETADDGYGEDMLPGEGFIDK